MNYEIIGSKVLSIDTVFENRGVDKSILTKRELHSPKLIKNLLESVQLTKDFLDNGDFIEIVQDPDADGYTSTAILARFLERNGLPKERIAIQVKEDKSHGIDLEGSLESHRRALEKGKRLLVIAPDCSSNEHELHRKLSEQGVSVIVLDHHDAYKYSDYALMVNIQLDDYPNKDLSGAGLVLKFIELWESEFGSEISSKDFYDLATVGIVADMMLLNNHENVSIVQEGIRSIKSPFLKALYRKQEYSMGGVVTPIGISFYIAPLINAVTREGTLEEKFIVLDALLANVDYDVPSKKRGAKLGDTETICEQAARIMTNIKSRQARKVKSTTEFISSKLDDSEDKLLIIDLEHSIPKEYTGLVANQMMAQYRKPVLVGNQYGDFLRGSGRTDDQSDLPDLKTFLNESNLVEMAEGHAAAHGFSVPIENREKLIDYANKALSDIQFDRTYKVDYSMSTADIGSIQGRSLIEAIDNMKGYWGRGLSEPLFLFNSIQLYRADKNFSFEGDFDVKTLRFQVGGIDFVAFRVPTEKLELLEKSGNCLIDALGRVSSYQGRTQVILTEFEVIGRKKFVF